MIEQIERPDRARQMIVQVGRELRRPHRSCSPRPSD
jgi:hypothetical protein